MVARGKTNLPLIEIVARFFAFSFLPLVAVSLGYLETGIIGLVFASWFFVGLLVSQALFFLKKARKWELAELGVLVAAGGTLVTFVPGYSVLFLPIGWLLLIIIMSQDVAVERGWWK